MLLTSSVQCTDFPENMREDAPIAECLDGFAIVPLKSSQCAYYNILGFFEIRRVGGFIDSMGS